MPNDQPCILLVDDEPINLLLLEDLLQSEGYATLSAESGKKALEIANQSLPDMILLDVMMPDMDGFEVCQQLRKNVNLQSVPVIFLTALDDDDARIKGLEMMGDDYITKPIKSNLLVKKISTTLRLHQIRTQQSHLQGGQQMKEKSQRHIAAAWQINQALTEKFRLFVPEQFLQRIAPQGVESIKLGNAKEEEISIIFCDIRGFTAIAESQQATDTFKWLNAFFTQMNQAIADEHGFIDKFLGDAIMAVFDRPNCHVRDALNAAVMMRQNLREFNANRQLFNLEMPVNIGIGVHTGTGLIGTLGANSRMDSTVIGDVVNTASRLEDLTKVYGCQVIASEAAIAQLNPTDLFHLRWIDQVAPRGKQKPINLYEVLGTQIYPIDEGKIESLPVFKLGLQALQDGNLEIAYTYFKNIVKEDPADSVAALYVERCQSRLGLEPADLQIWDEMPVR